MHQDFLPIHGSEFAANNANILRQLFGSFFQITLTHVVRNQLPGNDSLRKHEGLKWVFVTSLLMPIKVFVREELVTCFTSAVHAKFAPQTRRQFKISQVILEESRTVASTLSCCDAFTQPVFEVRIVVEHAAMN